MCMCVYEYNRLFEKYATRQTFACQFEVLTEMWELNSAYRVKCFLNLIFTKYFYKNTQMSFLTTPSLTRRTVANHFPCIRGNATCFPGSRGRRLASRQLFRELTCTCAQFVCCHVDVFWISTVTDNFWRKSSWKSGRRTFHVSYFAWVAAEANLFSREPTKAAFHGFPRLHEKTGSFSEYEKPASCTQYTQWAAWADT